MKRERVEAEVLCVPNDPVYVGASVRSIKLKRGSMVFGGQLFCELILEGNKGVKSLRMDESVQDALVVDVWCQERQKVGPGDRLFSYLQCQHPVVVRGLCTQCGADLDKSEHLSKRKQLLPSQPDILFGESVLSAVAQKTIARLLRARKLSLVLDLDLTLLHATSDMRHREVLARAPEDDTREIHEFGIGGAPHLVKLRPGLREFLAECNTMFEMHIFTHGNKAYGSIIASILDPTGEYFSPQENIGERRVTTLDDTYTRHEKLDKMAKGIADYKRLERLFPVSDNHVLVLDDNYVWGNTPNIIRVVPFFFWNSRVLPVERVGEFEVNSNAPPREIPLHTLYYSESAHEGHLPELMALLRSIHERFFQEVELNPDVHVAKIFKDVRSQVLAGCRVVLSGIYPAGYPEDQKALVKLCQDYGASIIENVDANSGVTHVVSANDGTKKARDGRKIPGVHVVHVNWLIDSVRHFRRMPEADYAQLPAERVVDKKIDRLMSELSWAYLAPVKSSKENSDVDHVMMMSSSSSSSLSDEGNDDDDDGLDDDDKKMMEQLMEEIGDDEE